MIDLNAKKVSDLCVKCGMCCDGTLFQKGNIKNETDKKHIADLGMQIFQENDSFFFPQPCIFFDKCCTIYEKKRPEVCGNFICTPLKNYEKGEIEFEIAEGQILKLLNLKKDMKEKANEFEEFKGLAWPDFLLTLEHIINEPKPEDLKKFGVLIIYYTAFSAAKKVVSTPKTII